MNVFDLFCWTGAAGVGRSGDFCVHWGRVDAAGGFGAGDVSCFTLVWVLSLFLVVFSSYGLGMIGFLC